MSLRERVRRRFEAVNGVHPMTEADDRYVGEWYAPLESVARDRGVAPDDVRTHMLAGLLPLPGYLRSDGSEMVPRDLYALADRAGSVAELGGWFRAHWTDAETAEREWRAYLEGRYVCLRTVSPETIRRKDELVAEIEAALEAPRAADEAWLRTVHALVDELDELEPPFAPYDRLRFGGAVSRDRLIGAVRQAYPGPSRSATTHSSEL